MTHTPAPWTSNVKDYGSAGHNAYVGVDAADGTVVAHVLCYREPNLTDVPFAANARLIAAAPELLGALKDCAEFFELNMDKLFGPGHDIQMAAGASLAISKIQAAISKAENGQ